MPRALVQRLLHLIQSQLHLPLQHQSLILLLLVAVVVVVSLAQEVDLAAVVVQVDISHLRLAYQVELVTQLQLEQVAQVNLQAQQRVMEATQYLLP
jgi:hypothetical protein